MIKKTFWMLLLLSGVCAVNAQVLRIGDVITLRDGSQGVVYYLHPDGSGGWAVALTDAATQIAWGETTNIEGLQDYNSNYPQVMLSDTAGYTNTQILRAAQGSNPSYAAGAVDFANGWVLPSPEQMYMLFVQSPLVKPALLAAGGTFFTEHAYYWVSAEVDDQYAWFFYFNNPGGYSGFFQTLYKLSHGHVRAVCNFTYPLYCWNTGAGTSSIEAVPDHTSDYSVTVRSGYKSQGSAETSIVVLPNAFSITEQAACGSYEWNGNTYTNSGVYTLHLNAANGCDSAAILKLAISNMQDVSIAAIDSSLCLGDSITLQGSYDFRLPPPVAEGDILCTDGSIVKPDNFLASGKTALGVVFYVDSTGMHGWAVHPHDQADTVAWCGGYQNTEDLPGVSNYSYSTNNDVYPDFVGYSNTQGIWAAGDSISYPAAHCVDFPNGWYLPSIGQLNMLYSMMPFVNSSLELVGGEPFPINSNWSYWSSTEVGGSYYAYAWLLDNKGRNTYNYKVYDNYSAYEYYPDSSYEIINYYSRVRSIRDF